MTEACLPHMPHGDASIIHISSVRAHFSEANSEVCAMPQAARTLCCCFVKVTASKVSNTRCRHCEYLLGSAEQRSPASSNCLEIPQISLQQMLVVVTELHMMISGRAALLTPHIWQNCSRSASPLLLAATRPVWVQRVHVSLWCQLSELVPAGLWINQGWTDWSHKGSSSLSG